MKNILTYSNIVSRMVMKCCAGGRLGQDYEFLMFVFYVHVAVHFKFVARPSNSLNLADPTLRSADWFKLKEEIYTIENVLRTD
jgi:hypothetical protein